MIRVAALILAGLVSQGCLVLSLQPAYDDASVAWDEGLVGRWRAAEDNVDVTIEPGVWRSYRIHYKHPVEEADFTAHLTIVDDTRFLDLMPAKGVDYGAVLVPAHLVIKIARDGDRCQVWSLDYENLRAAVKAARPGAAGASLDERQYVLLTRPTEALRAWLRARTEKDFDAPATFERISP